MASGTDGNITWEFNEGTGLLTLSGTGAMTYHGSSSDYPWGSYKNDITKIVIKSGVTSIEWSVFHTYTSLTSVTIGKDITLIASYAFYNCTALKEIIFKSSSAPTLNSSSFLLGTSSSSVSATVYTKGGWGSNSVFTTNVRGKYTTFTYVEYKGTNVNVNVEGTWKESTPYVNVNGEWKEVTAVFVNVAGVWKEV